MLLTGRRAFERYRCDLPLTLVVGDQEFPAQAADLSLGGLFALGGTDVEYGTELTVRFRVPALKEDTELTAIARWVKPGEGIGLQFQKLRAIQVWALNQYFRILEEATE